MAQASRNQVATRYHAGIEQIRKGLTCLSELHQELERDDTYASVRANLLKLLHDMDELLLRETQPPPDFGPDDGAPEERPISPHLEPAAETTEPEAGG